MKNRRKGKGSLEMLRERRVKALSALQKVKEFEARQLSEGAQWVSIDERTSVLRKTKIPAGETLAGIKKRERI